MNRIVLRIYSYIVYRISYVSDKSRLGGGKKRKVVFSSGASNEETIRAPGILKNELHVSVADGMPNTSRETIV